MPKIFNKSTNRQGLIVYGGESSTDYGIVVSEAPAFDKSKRRCTVYNVQGRNGSIIFQDGSFEDVPKNYKVWLAEDDGKNLAERVNAFTAWLYSKTGYQRLEDSFEPEVFRLAYYNGGQDISNELTIYGETTISFTCRAERFYKDSELEQVVSNGSKIHNPTRFDSKPLIHIEGTGSVSISISGVTMTATLTDYINIDCDTMNAYRLPTENKNDKISGTFPLINPGTNTIGTTGSISKATIVPRYYTI